MNTITILDKVTNMAIMYTDNEVERMIEELKACKERGNNLEDSNVALNKNIRNIREEVRDFFSETEWSDGEQTVQKSDVNKLLQRIGSNKLTSTYSGEFTITGTFTLETDDDEEVGSAFQDDIEIHFNAGDYEVTDIEVVNVVEEYN